MLEEGSGAARLSAPWPLSPERSPSPAAPRRAPPARPGTTLRRQPCGAAPANPFLAGPPAGRPLLRILQPSRGCCAQGAAPAPAPREGTAPINPASGGTRSCGAEPLSKLCLQVSFWQGGGLSRQFLF